MRLQRDLSRSHLCWWRPGAVGLMLLTAGALPAGAIETADGSLALREAVQRPLFLDAELSALAGQPFVTVQMLGAPRNQEIGGGASEVATSDDGGGSSHTGDKFKAGLFSAIIPGTGQLYNRQQTKGLIFLGIDHVVGISSSLTDLGRGISKLQGWYEERKLFQRSMISGLYSLIAALLIKTTSASGKKTLGLRLALLGTSFLITLYVVRSLSFHYIDVLLEHAINDVHVFYLAELLGISCVITAGVFCRIEKR